MKYIHRQKGADAMYKTRHSHGEYMIIYTYSSGGSLVTADATYLIKRGALAVISPGKHHYTMPTLPENYERSKLPDSLLSNATPRAFWANGFQGVIHRRILEENNGR